MHDDSRSTASRQAARAGWQEGPRLGEDGRLRVAARPQEPMPQLANDAHRDPSDRDGPATRYAARLLASLEMPETLPRANEPDQSPAAAWAASGAMALTGETDGPALPAPAPVASCAAGAARALAALATATTGRDLASLDGGALLGERAALSSPPLVRRGRISVGGGARLIACGDGSCIALNLARPDDRALIPAWLETAPLTARSPRGSAHDLEGPEGDDGEAAWGIVEMAARERAAGPLVDRGRLMGLAVSMARADAPEGARTWHRRCVLAPPRPVPTRPLVVDLSALWAGPLCGQLLAAAGARVVKVESAARPDGARAGDPRFFDCMNGEKESVALDFGSPAGRSALGTLVAAADIVIEASRPRALEQLGIHADAVVRDHGVTWVGITGHGRDAPARDWVAFGDDAAAAGGLLASTGDGRPVFCGDAIADPLTGLHAAVAALAALAQGGGTRVDLSLSGVAAWVRAQDAHGDEPAANAASTDPRSAPLHPAAPRARPAVRPAPPLGADTARVLHELGIPC